MKFQRLTILAAIKNRRGGSALIIALCFLVIISAVLLALYTGVRNDLVSSRYFAGGQATILLSDTAVNLVEGQITSASTQPLVSWASQPGMIHAYTQAGTNTAYKLYSSGTMVVTGWGQSNMLAETTAMEGWKTATDSSSYNAMWCDLNAPAVVNRTDPTNPSNTIATPVFPIVDPGAVYQNGAGVQGFGFDSTAVHGTSFPASATDTTRRLPMPVQWIYLLKQGQMIAPSSLSGSVATFTGTTVPSSSNPIIGRIAFWADDDTCKLNINTASEGTYWDTPRANVQPEWYLGYTVPILGEFQTISGHPATTSLDPVLGDLLPRPSFQDNSISSSGTLNVTATGTGSYSQLQAYYALNPRITDTAVVYNPYSLSTTPVATTTSKASTVSTVRSDASSSPLVPAVVFKTDRLYATPDELLFNPTRSQNNTSISAATMAQRDFFLTAQSRAPETTLFGTPRICMWPIQQIISSSQVCQSARDKLISFCATLGNPTLGGTSTYYFQRGQVSLYNSTYQTSPASTSVSTDWNIARNQSLFTYATNMMETTVPGFGTSLASKWGTAPNYIGCQRLMTLALDMIRSGLSQVGTTTATGTTSAVSWSYRNEIQTPGNNAIRGSVIPLQVTTSSGTFSGIGRDWRVCSAAIQVIPISRVPKTAGPPAVDGWSSSDPEPATTGIQAILLLNFYNPMPTPQIVEPCFRISVTNASNAFGISLNGTFSAMSTGTVLLMNGIGGNGIFYRNYAFPGFAGLLNAATPPSSWPNQNTAGTYRTLTPGGTGSEASDEINNYPFLTQPLTMTYSGTTTPASTFSISGGSIQIQILEGYPKTATTAQVIQTETLTFPNWNNLPLPQSVTVNSASAATTAGDPALSTFQTACAGTGNRGAPNSYTWFLPGDIVGEVQFNPNAGTSANPSAQGDYRLLAIERNVPASWFTPNATYSGTVTAFTCTGTDTTVAAAVSHMQNRFSFAFQNANAGTTYGIGSGLDSPLAQNPRWGSTACTGATWTTGSGNYNYSQYYTVNPGGLVSTLKFLPDASAGSGLKPNSNTNTQPVIPPSASGYAPANSGGLGDWSTAYSAVGDGAILSAPDTAAWQTKGLGEPAFFVGQSDWTFSASEAVTEPNRVVPSPIGIFGSLPTPAKGSSSTSVSGGDGLGDDLQPWQNLLLCPNPAAYIAGGSHPGFGVGGTGTGPTALPPFTTSPPDHLFIDLFWMPVVEPYALSDPLSTSGKVNLNYEMEPFTHITRRTALVGVLTPVDIGAIPNSVSYDYKQPLTGTTSSNISTLPNPQTRFPLNLDLTGTTTPGGTPPSLFTSTSSPSATGCFSDFETRFSSGDVFRSASEVCMLRLVPSGQTISNINSWWSSTSSTGYGLTGLNMRESPYNQIYSRITTKSNTYTVHYWVQSLQQVSTPGRDWTKWNESQDVKNGEYRGNTTIERYLDPNTANLPDYTAISLSGSYTPIDSYYSWRVVSQKQFAPGSN
jgi:uncharacterized protein (TIGR02600 family)